MRAGGDRGRKRIDIAETCPDKNRLFWIIHWGYFQARSSVPDATLHEQKRLIACKLSRADGVTERLTAQLFSINWQDWMRLSSDLLFNILRGSELEVRSGRGRVISQLKSNTNHRSPIRHIFQRYYFFNLNAFAIDLCIVKISWLHTKCLHSAPHCPTSVSQMIREYSLIFTPRRFQVPEVRQQSRLRQFPQLSFSMQAV
jgi:hypothetical protein